MMQQNFHIREWLVAPDSNEIVGPNGAVKLDYKVMRLLVYFARNAGKDLPKEEILRAVWGEGVFSEEVLTVAVSSLRNALGDDSRTPKYIKTIPRFGYRMLVSPTSAPASTNPSQTARPPSALEILEWLEARVGLRFLIVAIIIILFLIVLMSKKHLH